MIHAVSLRAAAAALALALPLALLFVLSNAAPAPAQQSQSGKNRPAPAENPVVAIVSGDKVMLSDLLALHADLPEQIRKIPFERIYQPLLEQVIQTKLLSARARANGLDKTPAVKRTLRTFADRLLQRAYLTDHVDRTVTEDQLGQAYKDFVAGHQGEEQVKARHILVKTKKEAMAVVEALEKGGGFADLARKKSIGPSKTGGGDLGWFVQGPDGEAVRRCGVRPEERRLHEDAGADPVRLACHPAGGPPPGRRHRRSRRSATNSRRNWDASWPPPRSSACARAPRSSGSTRTESRLTMARPVRKKTGKKRSKTTRSGNRRLHTV